MEARIRGSTVARKLHIKIASSIHGASESIGLRHLGDVRFAVQVQLRRLMLWVVSVFHNGEEGENLNNFRQILRLFIGLYDDGRFQHKPDQKEGQRPYAWNVRTLLPSIRLCGAPP